MQSVKNNDCRSLWGDMNVQLSFFLLIGSRTKGYDFVSVCMQRYGFVRIKRKHGSVTFKQMIKEN